MGMSLCTLMSKSESRKEENRKGMFKRDRIEWLHFLQILKTRIATRSAVLVWQVLFLLDSIGSHSSDSQLYSSVPYNKKRDVILI